MAESTRRTPPTDARAAVTSGGTLATPPGSGVACAAPASAAAAAGCATALSAASAASPIIVAKAPSSAGSRLSLISNVVRAGQSARWAIDAAEASWFFAAFSVCSAGSASRPSRCVIRFSEMLSVTRFRSSLRPSRRSITFCTLCEVGGCLLGLGREWREGCHTPPVGERGSEVRLGARCFRCDSDHSPQATVLKKRRETARRWINHIGVASRVETIAPFKLVYSSRFSMRRNPAKWRNSLSLSSGVSNPSLSMHATDSE